MGVGISIYFSLTFEPCLTKTLASLFASFVLIFISHTRLYSRLFSLALLSISLGFVAAKVRTEWLSTPLLETKAEAIQITGRLVSIEEQPHRRRLTFDQLTFSEKRPPLHKIRLTIPLSSPLTANVGDYVSFTADLLPLSDPVSLTGYHFRRQAYFQGIGAIGRIKGMVKLLEPATTNQPFSLATTRHHITLLIRQHLPGQIGEIAAALTTGDRSGITPKMRQAFTDAGLAHILAISGLHLTLVAGFIFLFFRRSLALIPYLAENYPLKKWAAVLVMSATFGYLALSGFGIPGQRAFVMVSIAMIGILLDRDPLSLRLVAIAATVILLLRPESLLSASFQLSFAAVIGLIAAYEGGWAPLHQWTLEGSYLRRLLAYGIGIVATTIIATIATTPYTIAIFNRFTLQTLAGNILAIPLTSLLIMPTAMICILSLLFGGWEFSFHLLGLSLHWLTQIAQRVASWPGAALFVPTPPFVFLLFITFGGLWICCWKSRWRWWGILPYSMGIFSFLLFHPADIYIAGDGSVMAYRKDDTLYASDLKRGGFFTDQWMKELGLKEKRAWPENHVRLGPVLLIHQIYSSRFDLPNNMCEEKVLITTGYAGSLCKKRGHIPGILIDRSNLKQDGTHQIWLTPQGIEVKSIRKYLGDRPWERPDQK